ncbi:hypothetical protein ES706_04626 [subsurface metagenome]
MDMTLNEILDFIGKLDDSPGSDTPRERFRVLLKSKLTELGQVRDYVQQCLRGSGDQYSRALQDLVNHIGELLGFEVDFGRYHGVQGQIGFDGHWNSKSGFHIIVEVKTTEVYAVKTATLVGYIDALISDKRIPDWGNTLGLYVIGRPDPETRQLENSIIAEKNTGRLRIISIESLVSLAEMMSVYDVSHEDILAVLRPSTPIVDPVVSIMTRLVAQRSQSTEVEKIPSQELPEAGGGNYIITPTKSDEDRSAEEIIKSLVGKECVYAFGERTPCRKDLKPGDWICFYATTIGVVAHAKVISIPERKQHPSIGHPEDYPWLFRLSDVKLYTENPVVVDAQLRSKLDAFKDRTANKNWAWFVQATRWVTEHDFLLLTRQEE